MVTGAPAPFYNVFLIISQPNESIDKNRDKLPLALRTKGVRNKNERKQVLKRSRLIGFRI